MLHGSAEGPRGARWEDRAGEDTAGGYNAWGDTGEPPVAARRGRNLRWLALSLCAASFLIAAGMAYRAFPRATTDFGPAYVLPGEFERHSGLLIGWRASMERAMYAELAEIAAAATHSVPVTILVPDRAGSEHARRLLRECDADLTRVDFLVAPVNSPWIRDYGPLQVKAPDGGYVIVDTTSEVPPRPHEKTPWHIAQRLNQEYREAPLILDGGNILSNGAGLCLTSTLVLQQNSAEQNLDEEEVEALIREYLGARELVILQPLLGEPTGHVDMFAAFTAPDTLVLGRYDPAVDPVNARILDHHAAQLAGLPTAAGPLQVERIPMPARVDDRWLTYTNIVCLNDQLLVPRYCEVPSEVEQEAFGTLSRLLPGRRLVPVSAGALMRHEGGPHCATAHLFRLTGT